MRSASRRRRVARRLGGGLLTLAAAGPLAGCSTTMMTAARLQLNDARIRAAEVSSEVPRSATNPTARVTRLQVLRVGGRTAYVVTVRNDGRRAVSDLPISVGYTRRHTLTYLNAKQTLSYFQAHLPAIAAARQITWVYAAPSLPAGVVPFAVVGARPNPLAETVTLPGIAARVARRPSGSSGLTVSVRNLSGIPQYQLPVYAFADRGRRLVAAGTTSVTTLEGGSELTVRLSLVGDAEGARLTVEAPPTIFN